MGSYSGQASITTWLRPKMASFMSAKPGMVPFLQGPPPPFYLLVPLRELVTDAVTQLAICSVVTILKFLICEQAAPTF